MVAPVQKPVSRNVRGATDGATGLTAAQVAAERQDTKDVQSFLVPAELQKQFPLGK
jgi:hypothetical protein